MDAATFTPIQAAVAALASQAADLQSAGAIRSDHDTKWQSLRVGLDQLAELMATAPAAPAAAAFDTLSQLVHLVSDKVDAVALHLGA